LEAVALGLLFNGGVAVIGSEREKVRWSVTVAKEYQTMKVPLAIVWKW